jgi:NAD(P)-dependent dehydrogenase (short-subunit alcohol dehydrogenase family)
VPGRSLAPGQPSDRPGSPLTPTGHTPAHFPPSPDQDQGFLSLFSLTGRTALVTGGSSGIGRAIAGALAKAGARVVIIARHEGPLADAVGELAAAGCQAAWVSADLADRAAAQRGAAAAAEPFGEPDIVVSAAGVNIRPPLGELTPADWDTLMAVNLTAPFLLGQRFGPPMAERGWGRIVNVTSTAGKRPSQTWPAYSVAKAAQHSLSRLYADYWAARGVHVNVVAPGPTGTSLWRGPGGLAEQVAAREGITPEEAIARHAAKVPLGRFGEPEEAAGVIAFLCSERASWVTGAAWSADGGTWQSML